MIQGTWGGGGFARQGGGSIKKKERGISTKEKMGGKRGHFVLTEKGGGLKTPDYMMGGEGVQLLGGAQGKGRKQQKKKKPGRKT